ncbi:Protein SSUH2 -like protein [Halotydeus destructor]|nr:Protein SSUH2 -like protein [Halotydeus destructor]
MSQRVMQNMAANYVQGTPEGYYDAKSPATAPPLDHLDVPPGYEEASWTPVPLAPPAYVPSGDFQTNLPDRGMSGSNQITEEEVRVALADFAAENCCYGGQPVEQMVIRDISMNSSFHYKLETFCERRETAWVVEPYNGQLIDGPQNGPSPGPWQVIATPEVTFDQSTRKYEVPHSANVRLCHTCTGNCRVRCKMCAGMGGSNCSWCSGSGHIYSEALKRNERCIHCTGTGRQRCYTCHGLGQVTCTVCAGSGQLKCYLELTVSWVNHEDDFVSDQTGMSESLIKQVTGHVGVDERAPRVFALTNFPDRRILDASRGLITKHATSYPMERILEQKHNVRLVPVALVTYELSHRSGTFHVYGLERKVYFPDYPAKCCCGYCSIL